MIKNLKIKTIRFKTSTSSKDVVNIKLKINEQVIDMGHYQLGGEITLKQTIKLYKGDVFAIEFDGGVEFALYNLVIKK